MLRVAQRSAILLYGADGFKVQRSPVLRVAQRSASLLWPPGCFTPSPTGGPGGSEW